jgi:hypothetical protein
MARMNRKNLMEEFASRPICCDVAMGNCDYENGVKMRLMDVSKAEEVFAAMPGFGGKYNKLGFDGVICMGTEGWITDSKGFGAQDREIWRIKFKDDDEDLAPSTEHCRNFIECVRSRKETMCPVEMAIRTKSTASDRCPVSPSIFNSSRLPDRLPFNPPSRPTVTVRRSDGDSRFHILDKPLHDLIHLEKRP